MLERTEALLAELSALKEVTRVQAKVLADFERMASLPIDQTWHERREEALKVLQAGESGKQRFVWRSRTGGYSR